MPVMQLEVPFEQIVNLMAQLTEEQKTSIRKKLSSENWIKKLYELFKDVREETRKFSEKEINRDIEEAIKEVRLKKEKVK